MSRRARYAVIIAVLILGFVGVMVAVPPLLWVFIAVSCVLLSLGGMFALIWALIKAFEWADRGK